MLFVLPSQSSLRDASSPKVGALGSPRKVHLFAKASPFGRGVTAGDGEGEDADQREQTEGVPRLTGQISLLFVPNSTFWGENRKRLSKVHKKAAQSLAGTLLTVPRRKFLRNRTTN